jgi:hypothetical protein
MMSDLDRRAAEAFHPIDEGAPRPSPWFWPVLLSIAFLVYELTADPGLGAAIACTKFGWDDFLTASWLYRRDMNRARGHAELWLACAVGLWKIAVTGIAVMFATAFLQAALRGAPAAGAPGLPARSYLAALTVSTLAFGSSTIATLRAFRLAWSNRVLLWYDDRLHRDRRLNRWPPSDQPVGRQNRAGLVLLTALVLTGIALPAAGLVASFFLLQLGRAHFGWPIGWAEPLVAALWLILSLALPILMLIGRDVIGARVLARSPIDCWSETRFALDSSEESVDHWQGESGMR